MKEGWTYVPFEEVCDSMTKGPFGSDIKKSLYVPKSENTYKVYIQANAIEKDASIGDYYISKEYFDAKMYRFEVKPNDFIITCDGTLGRYLQLPHTMERGIISASLLRITLNSRIVPRFFEYLWDGYIMGRLTSDIRNSALVHLPSATKIGKVRIPLPSLDEQERIVAELNLLSNIINNQQAQLKELDTLALSVFYDMFGDPIDNEKGWDVKAMGEVGTFQRGSGLSKQDLVNVGFPCVLYGQIHTRFGAFTKHHLACIPNELVHTAKIAHSGDVIMAITSEDVEGSCKSTAWLGGYDIAVGSDAAIYRHTLNGIYVSYYTQTQAFFNEKAKYAHGFKVTHISTKEIATIPIPIPPLSLQESFAEKIQAIENQKETIYKAIKETQTLFDYTMDKYFG